MMRTMAKHLKRILFKSIVSACMTLIMASSTIRQGKMSCLDALCSFYLPSVCNSNSDNKILSLLPWKPFNWTTPCLNSGSKPKTIWVSNRMETDNLWTSERKNIILWCLKHNRILSVSVCMPPYNIHIGGFFIIPGIQSLNDTHRLKDINQVIWYFTEHSKLEDCLVTICGFAK